MAIGVRREVDLDDPVARDDDPLVDGVQQLKPCHVAAAAEPEGAQWYDLGGM